MQGGSCSRSKSPLLPAVARHQLNGGLVLGAHLLGRHAVGLEGAETLEDRVVAVALERIFVVGLGVAATAGGLGQELNQFQSGLGVLGGFHHPCT